MTWRRFQATLMELSVWMRPFCVSKTLPTDVGLALPAWSIWPDEPCTWHSAVFCETTDPAPITARAQSYREPDVRNARKDNSARTPVQPRDDCRVRHHATERRRVWVRQVEEVLHVRSTCAAQGGGARDVAERDLCLSLIHI